MTLAEHAARIPPATLQGIPEYVRHRVPPGCFLQSVLCNDQRNAVGWADEGNRAALADIVLFLHWEVPARCWGSADAVNAWLLHCNGCSRGRPRGAACPRCRKPLCDECFGEDACPCDDVALAAAARDERSVDRTG
jgi:hypothetical protein